MRPSPLRWQGWPGLPRAMALADGLCWDSLSRGDTPRCGSHPLRADLPRRRPAQLLGLGIHHPLGEPLDQLPEQVRARRCQRVIDRSPVTGTMSLTATLFSFDSDEAFRRITRWPPRVTPTRPPRTNRSELSSNPIHHSRGREPWRFWQASWSDGLAAAEFHMMHVAAVRRGGLPGPHGLPSRSRVRRRARRGAAPGTRMAGQCPGCGRRRSRSAARTISPGRWCAPAPRAEAAWA
jgi:hypothetical protein